MGFRTSITCKYKYQPPKIAYWMGSILNSINQTTKNLNTTNNVPPFLAQHSCRISDDGCHIIAHRDPNTRQHANCGILMVKLIIIDKLSQDV